MVSVLVASAVVTFYDLYMISLFLEHGLGINQRGFQLGIWCCHRTGAELETRVAIRFFVRMVSVLFSFCCRHFLQFDFDLTVSRACLRHHSTRISIRNTVVLLDWRRIGNSCRNPFFCDDGKCFCCFCRCHFLQFVYDLTVSLAQRRYHLTQNLMRKTVVLSDGWRARNLCRDRVFCDDGEYFDFVLSSSLFTTRMPSHEFYCMSDASINS